MLSKSQDLVAAAIVRTLGRSIREAAAIAEELTGRELADVINIATSLPSPGVAIAALLYRARLRQVRQMYEFDPIGAADLKIQAKREASDYAKWIESHGTGFCKGRVGEPRKRD